MKKIFVSNVVKLLQEINNAESSLIWINQGESNIGLKLYQITRKQRWIIENKYEREEKLNIKHLNLPIYGYFIKKKKEKIPLVNIFYSEEISQHHKNVEAKIFQIPGQCNELCTITFPIRAERDKSSTLTNPMHTPCTYTSPSINRISPPSIAGPKSNVEYLIRTVERAFVTRISKNFSSRNLRI